MDRLMGDLRDYEKGCQVWVGDKWVHYSDKSSQEANNAIFEQLNPNKDSEHG